MLRTTLNTPEGSIGYSTEDDWTANAQMVLNLALSDRDNKMAGFEFGIYGIDQNTTFFKTVCVLKLYLYMRQDSENTVTASFRQTRIKG